VDQDNPHTKCLTQNINFNRLSFDLVQEFLRKEASNLDPGSSTDAVARHVSFAHIICTVLFQAA